MTSLSGVRSWFSSRPPPTLRSVTQPAKPAVDSGIQRTRGAVELLAMQAQPSARKKRLDAFFDKCQPTFFVHGRPVKVALHFASNYGKKGKKGVRRAQSKIAHLLGGRRYQQLFNRDIGPATTTRGRPEQLQRSIQALIDAGALERSYPDDPPGKAIRKLMFDLHIGLDCIGYTLAALEYLNGRGNSYKPAQELGIGDRHKFDFGAFPKVKFERVRPGDVLHLPPRIRDNGIGQRQHNVIVRDNRLVALSPRKKFELQGVQIPKSFIGNARRLRLFRVDSAWGAGPEGAHGGVERRYWILNPETGRWGSTYAAHFYEGPAPDGHDKIIAVRVR